MSSPYKTQWNFLKKSAEAGKVPHALLFCGRDSDGMKELALDFFRLLNGQDPRGKITPDLFVISPGQEKEIKISQIRELHSRFSLRSHSASCKMAVIEQAHRLNEEAQSAFLKLLEEPKGDTVFILISQYPEMFFGTILSRLEKVKFYSPCPACKKERVMEISRLSKACLAERFLYAKKMSQDKEKLKETFEDWIICFREALLSRASGDSGKKLEKIHKTLKTLQTAHFLISTTNCNPRLALETVLLDF